MKIISEASYRDFFKFLSRNNLKQDESKIAEYIGEEKALRFDQLLGRAIAEECITISKAAALKNQRITEFRKSFLPG